MLTAIQFLPHYYSIAACVIGNPHGRQHRRDHAFILHCTPTSIPALLLIQSDQELSGWKVLGQTYFTQRPEPKSLSTGLRSLPQPAVILTVICMLNDGNVSLYIAIPWRLYTCFITYCLTHRHGGLGALFRYFPYTLSRFVSWNWTAPY